MFPPFLLCPFSLLLLLVSCCDPLYTLSETSSLAMCSFPLNISSLLHRKGKDAAHQNMPENTLHTGLHQPPTSGAAASSSPPPLTVTVDGVVWTQVTEEEKTILQAHLPVVSGKPTKIHHTSPLGVDFAKEEFLHVRELLIFRSMFPLESVERIIDATNEKLEEGAKTSEAEFWTLLGLIFALSVSPLHEADEHWQQSNHGVFSGSHFGRFMPRDRFHHLIGALRLDEYDAEDEKVSAGTLVEKVIPSR